MPNLETKTVLCVVLAVFGGQAAGAENWHAENTENPLTRNKFCQLTSSVQKTSDGYGETPVSLLYDGKYLIVRTESNLDKSFRDLRLTVDGKLQFQSERVERDNFLVFDQDMPALLQSLRKGQTATVALRFWSTYPATRSFPVNFDLNGFSKAQDNLATCNSAPGLD